MAKKKQQPKAPEAKKESIEMKEIQDIFEELSSLPKTYIDRLNLAIENRKQRKDAAKANAKAGQGLEGQKG